MLTTFQIETDGCGLFDVTDKVIAALGRSGVTNGILITSIPHSTASITVTSPWDTLGLEDVHDEIERLVPTRVDFKHQYDTPQDAAGHVKAAIVGHARTFIVADGQLGLGSSQKIYFWEFDGPRKRSVQVKVIGDVS